MNKRGGGIAAYVHSSLKVDTLKYEELNQSDQDIEIFVVNINKKCSKAITVITLYRPPQGNVTKCVEKLRSVLLSLNNTENTIVIGDFNLDYKNKKASRGLNSN